MKKLIKISLVVMCFCLIIGFIIIIFSNNMNNVRTVEINRKTKMLNKIDRQVNTLSSSSYLQSQDESVMLQLTELCLLFQHELELFEFREVLISKTNYFLRELYQLYPKITTKFIDELFKDGNISKELKLIIFNCITNDVFLPRIMLIKNMYIYETIDIYSYRMFLTYLNKDIDLAVRISNHRHNITIVGRIWLLHIVIKNKEGLMFVARKVREGLDISKISVDCLSGCEELNVSPYLQMLERNA